MTSLRDRGVLARLSLCLLAIVILSFVVQAWKTPFAWRHGDRPAHGILATVDFKRINSRETRRRREQATDRVPLHFRREELQADALTDELRWDFRAVAESMSLDNLSPEARAAFGLDSESKTLAAPTSKEKYETLFRLVRAADQKADGVTEQARIERVEGLLAEFHQILLVVDQPGIVDRNDLNESAHLELRPGQRLAIESEDESDAIVAGVSDVDLPSMMKPGGRIAAIWESVPLLSTIQPSIESWLKGHVQPTLRLDEPGTLQAQTDARDQVDIVYERYRQSSMLVGPGEMISEEKLDLLRDEYNEAEQQVPLYLRLIRTGTVLLMMVVLAVINGAYLVRNEPGLVHSYSRLSVYLGAMILAVGLGCWSTQTQVLRAEVVPVVVMAMIFAVAYNQIMGALTAMTISLLLTLATSGELTEFVVLISVSATAVILLSRVPSRSTLVKVGFVTGLAFFVIDCGMGVLKSQSLDIFWSDGQLISEAFKGAAWCLGAGFLVAGSLPFIERVFGVVTDISLLEMSDISHPLLQELVRRAPGTYNHSISVATIAETAAESIGANGLLVRVGAYFHDIGKMLKPEYFIENMTEGMTSRHDDLAPAMSTLIIIGHVKDGVDLALEHHLPQPMVDFIEQHHGTTLVQYFYHEAKKQAEVDSDHRTDAEESSFRYPGPKPQTKEAGVMMLSDAVESASRTLSEPTPRRIETLVHKITMDKLLDGQFEESPLTLSEIRTIEESLTQSLIAIYHGRIKYPEQQRSA
ncbi:MAG: HDIG domain-containing protein [Planctomycetaceae bacterium]|nr:HDIG domain-containing protein [Planctomycetaceae bacterium]